MPNEGPKSCCRTIVSSPAVSVFARPGMGRALAARPIGAARIAAAIDAIFIDFAKSSSTYCGDHFSKDER